MNKHGAGIWPFSVSTGFFPHCQRIRQNWAESCVKGLSKEVTRWSPEWGLCDCVQEWTQCLRLWINKPDLIILMDLDTSTSGGRNSECDVDWIAVGISRWAQWAPRLGQTSFAAAIDILGPRKHIWLDPLGWIFSSTREPCGRTMASLRSLGFYRDCGQQWAKKSCS